MNTNIIYQHYNTISRKSYIGLTTKTMNDRWKEHLYIAFRTNDDGSFKSTIKFHRAIRKYPLDSWLHIELYQYRDDGTELPLEEYEKFFIAKHDTYRNGYNSTTGGEGASGEVHRKLKVANRKDSVKGYTWAEDQQAFRVKQSYLGKPLHFGYYKLEQDAQDRSDYLMSLSDEDLLKEYDVYTSGRSNRTKGYHFDKNTGKWRVQFKIDGKNKSFGSYLTEEEAINRVKQVREELGL